jgi:hypothetical protein
MDERSVPYGRRDPGVSARYPFGSAPEEAPMSTAIQPFRIAASEAALDDLRRRLHATRWPERETVDDW